MLVLAGQHKRSNPRWTSCITICSLLSPGALEVQSFSKVSLVVCSFLQKRVMKSSWFNFLFSVSLIRHFCFLFHINLLLSSYFIQPFGHDFYLFRPSDKFDDIKLHEASLLLKAIRNSNLAKFITEDIVLFDQTLTDLFPNMTKLSQNDKIFQVNMIWLTTFFYHLFWSENLIFVFCDKA